MFCALMGDCGTSSEGSQRPCSALFATRVIALESHYEISNNPCKSMHSNTSRLEAIASRLEAIALRLKTIALRLEALALR